MMLHLQVLSLYFTLYFNSTTFWRRIVLHYIYVITLVTSYFADFMLHQSHGSFYFHFIGT